MFDIRKLNLKDFQITLEDGTVLTLKSPKMNVMRKIMKKSNVLTSVGDDMSDEEFTAIIDLMALMLNSNLENKKLSNEYIEEAFDFGQMHMFAQKYMEWLTSLYKEKN